MGGAARQARSVAAGPDAPDVQLPDRPRRSWRDRVRHAVDLTVAFVLLEDAEPAEQPARAARAAARTEEPTVRDRASARPPRASVDVPHPHRKPLRPLPRPRRPGAAAHRPQVCIAPVGAVPAEPPKRRSRVA